MLYLLGVEIAATVNASDIEFARKKLEAALQIQDWAVAQGIDIKLIRVKAEEIAAAATYQVPQKMS